MRERQCSVYSVSLCSADEMRSVYADAGLTLRQEANSTRQAGLLAAILDEEGR